MNSRTSVHAVSLSFNQTLQVTTCNHWEVALISELNDVAYIVIESSYCWCTNCCCNWSQNMTVTYWEINIYIIEQGWETLVLNLYVYHYMWRFSVKPHIREWPWHWWHQSCLMSSIDIVCSIRYWIIKHCAITSPSRSVLKTPNNIFHSIMIHAPPSICIPVAYKEVFVYLISTSLNRYYAKEVLAGQILN